MQDRLMSMSSTMTGACTCCCISFCHMLQGVNVGSGPSASVGIVFFPERFVSEIYGHVQHVEPQSNIPLKQFLEGVLCVQLVLGDRDEGTQCAPRNCFTATLRQLALLPCREV